MRGYSLIIDLRRRDRCQVECPAVAQEVASVAAHQVVSVVSGAQECTRDSWAPEDQEDQVAQASVVHLESSPDLEWAATVDPVDQEDPEALAASVVVSAVPVEE